MTAPGDDLFDLLGPLPQGRLAIEASAGTGKTFALAGLATRFIAEGGVAPSELLIVTFTRAATNELRSRVREQLTKAAAYLGNELPESQEDDLLVHLASRDQELRLGRLRQAITEFDAAAITTIHGFATQVRGSFGTSASTDLDARLDTGAEDLVKASSADALASAAAAGLPADHLPKLKDLTRFTALRLGRPRMVLAPVPGQDGAGPAVGVLRELVEEAKDLVDRRRRHEGTLSFDDLLSQLHRELEGPGSDAVVDALQRRFKVALIDEFQDTDDLQWKIFQRIFGGRGNEASMVLVGDPKQAIYSFRGADVQAYLLAVGPGSGTERRCLATNWRSDGALLGALDTLFTGASFGDDNIPFVTVEPVEGNRERRLTDAGGNSLPTLSLRLAFGHGIQQSARRGAVDEVLVESAVRAITADLVARVRDLLDTARLPVEDGGSPTKRVRPSDIAVLVSTAAQGNEVQRALLRQGVPAVISGGDSVLQSPAAQQMRFLLYAMDRPTDLRRARTFALSWFVGWSAEELAHASEKELDSRQEQLRAWSDMLADHSVAEVLARVWTETGVVARVLGHDDGDRNLTDLDHLAELCSGSTPTGMSSTAGLLALLDAKPEQEEDAEVEGDVAARRIESEDAAVQIMTVWKAKGLEFPIVCLPMLWRKPKSREVIYTDPESGRKTLDLADGKGWPENRTAKRRRDLAAEEATGEQLRLLYVAMTRARHRTIVWWANARHSSKTALARVLFARTDGLIDVAQFAGAQAQVLSNQARVAALEPLPVLEKGNITVDVIDGVRAGTGRWVDASSEAGHPALTRATLDRPLDRLTRRWSFTAITHQASYSGFDPYDATVSDGGAGDEGGADTADEDREPSATGLPGGGVGLGDARVAGSAPSVAAPTGPTGPMDLLPAGTAFGSLVHSVLEKIDFSVADVDAALAAAIDAELAWCQLDLTPTSPPTAGGSDGRQLLIEGLGAVLETPLGRIGGERRLADIGPADRLSELSFDFRLGDVGNRAKLRAIGRLVVDHLDSSDPLRPWAARLADGAVDLELAGHLTGSIDLVLRLRDADGGQRFVVADYKTNRLTPRGQVPSPDDYAPGRMVVAMEEHDYPLQALLYTVALHRYLRWRLTPYDPASHLGGAAYLFVRGMTGADVATSDQRPHGVLDWSIPASLVVELSSLLDGRPARGGRR